MLKTLRISFALKNTYRVNGILHSLKQIPLLKRVLPDRLYQVRGLKIFANVLSVLWEIVSIFLGKFLYFLTMVCGVGLLHERTPAGLGFLHILLFLTLIGSYMNTSLFNPTRDKYYAMILLRMNARSYTLSNYGYALGKVVVGFLPFTILFGLDRGVPLWLCLLIPVCIAGAKVAVAADSLNRSMILIDDDSSVTVADINAKCRRVDNLGLVIIDYLQLMTSAGGKGYSGENRQQAVSDISRMLKIMAKELQVPVLCLSQLSRANEKREDKRPMLSDLRESGAIEQDADIVMFLYRDDYYKEDSEKRNIAECIVAKNRHGETGKVELRWMPEYTTFGTLENRYDEE